MKDVSKRLGSNYNNIITIYMLTLQGIKFLDSVCSIFEHHAPPYQQIVRVDQVKVDGEICHWLELLIQLVEIARPNSHSLLRLFLSGEQLVTGRYRHILVEDVSVC